MAGAKTPRFVMMGDLLESLGGVSADRVRLDPAPGTATKRDLLKFHNREKLYELVDGTLVEKVMGRAEAYVAHELGRLVGNFVVEHGLGFCTGADDLVEVMPRLVRGPDLCFTAWERCPERKVDPTAIAKVVPDLVVEVISRGNTRAEMARKRKEYFLGGVRVVWMIDPRKRSAEVYTAPDVKRAIPPTGSLDGGDVLPGFAVPLANLFDLLGSQAPNKPKP